MSQYGSSSNLNDTGYSGVGGGGGGEDDDIIIENDNISSIKSGSSTPNNNNSNTRYNSNSNINSNNGTILAKDWLAVSGLWCSGCGVYSVSRDDVGFHYRLELVACVLADLCHSTDRILYYIVACSRYDRLVDHQTHLGGMGDWRHRFCLYDDRSSAVRTERSDAAHHHLADHRD
ncbi:hypothetical protein PPL_02608 [Heterostelium album PN500]|uniref:Uncharacterized protein n=1 Tax=Heterostelium pallidum (strain ATCC 26659 / Pp 5 / PN500) TaxID=670386 RepID=D3B2J5_HETP5|nr:hypothetical protein PPL_02608 [Heterostelium album PN500]EFA83543.1 hypothetical protein PPL_02608 [Heterostelium album PN500]|eukprot:XP_020435660.1 hypothetical protein PPL_02608 [Heterostelium album PN500]